MNDTDPQGAGSNDRTFQPKEAKSASTGDVVVSIGTTVALLAFSVSLFGADATSGANQIALVIGAIVTSAIGLKNGHDWVDLERNIIGGIAAALPSILILLTVGSLIGAWMLSGTVPTMIYYGLLLLAPSLFYPAVCVLCAVVAASVGSSWTVAGTIGVALIGVATVMNLSVAVTAGAVISGAYFGDKMSPLSDTTNLAAAVTGTDIFDHIRHMVWTTVPSFLLALAGFGLISTFHSGSQGAGSLTSTIELLDTHFTISGWTLLPVALVVWLAARKVPPVAAIVAGAGLGIVIAVVLQRPVVLAFADAQGQPVAVALFKGGWQVLFDGFQSNIGNETLDSLLSRGGMSSMLKTVWLIIAAMTFGAAMESAGVLSRLLEWLASRAHSVGALIGATVATCISVNALAADQYMSVVMAGRMFGGEYKRRRLQMKNLSRVLEDSGTVTSALIPWNTCGAYMSAALGVPTSAYLPYCFFNLISPMVSLGYGYTGFSVAHTDDEESSKYSTKRREEA